MSLRKPAAPEHIEMHEQPLPGSTTAAHQSRREEIKVQLAQLKDDSSSWWAWITAAWFLILAFPLLLFPRFLLFLSTPANVSDFREILTPLEKFICTHLGIGLIALSLALITSIPSAPPIVRAGVVPPPQLHPLLVPLSIGEALTAFIAYNTRQIGALGIIIALGCGFSGLMGIWVAAFEGTGNYSNKTGADKHTSSFLFGNKAAASHQKKLWKKEKEDEVEMHPLRR